jgi:hypothetical protein
MATMTSGTAAPKKAQANGISKMEAVRRALAELGQDATRTEIQSFVKERLGIEMNADVVSTYKAHIARKAAKTTPVSAAAAQNKPAPMPRAKSSPAPVAKKPAPPAKKKPAPATGRNGTAGAIGLDDIRAVKDLVGRVGPDSLKTLIEVLVK